MSSLTKVCEHGSLERKCDVCNYRKELADANATIARLDQQAGNVLARIHRDGGHYISQHGWQKACIDAEAIVCRLQSENATLRESMRLLEWSEYPDTCPSCHHNEEDGHRSDCIIAKALSEGATH